MAARTVVPRWDSQVLVEEEGGRLSYEDMARSYVVALAREAFELEHVVVDEDGDLPFPCGTAVAYGSLERSGRLFRVWSRAVTDLKVDKAVLREVSDANNVATYARVYADRRSVWVEAMWPVEGLRASELFGMVAEVASTAHELGSMLAAVHGGRVTYPGGQVPERHCDDA